PGSPGRLAARLNAIAAIWLLASTDELAARAPAAVDRNVLSATRQEIEGFLRPRLAALPGMQAVAVRSLLEPLQDMMEDVARAGASRAEGADRWVWFDYAPIAEEFAKALAGK
ncbi:MAG: hypothetical protein ACLFP0_10760, partial [Rhodosalinus sp.]